MSQYNVIVVDIDDMADVLVEVEDLAASWRLLFCKLGIKEESSLAVIEKNSPGDVKTCFYEALKEWLRLNYDYQRHGRPTWRRLAEVVLTISKAVSERIVKKHVQRGS